MNILKNNIIKILFGVLIFTSFSSCDEGGNPNPGGTTTEVFAGDWYITSKNAVGVTLSESALHSTYNTSANDNTMWIDDHGNDGASSPSLKCKITMDIANGTFSAVAQPNVVQTGTVTITEGKIEKGAGKSRGGHTVDKISFKAVFSNASGSVLSYEGHKRTGFKEDEY